MHLSTLRPPTLACAAAAANPNAANAALALASGDGGANKVTVWDAASGAKRWEAACGGKMNSVAFSPDGASLASGDSGDYANKVTGSSPDQGEAV